MIFINCLHFFNDFCKQPEYPAPTTKAASAIQAYWKNQRVNTFEMNTHSQKNESQAPKTQQNGNMRKNSGIFGVNEEKSRAVQSNEQHSCPNEWSHQ